MTNDVYGLIERSSVPIPLYCGDAEPHGLHYHGARHVCTGNIAATQATDYPPAETCTVCGSPVRVMCYRGEGVCSGACREERASRAAEADLTVSEGAARVTGAGEGFEGSERRVSYFDVLRGMTTSRRLLAAVDAAEEAHRRKRDMCPDHPAIPRVDCVCQLEENA